MGQIFGPGVGLCYPFYLKALNSLGTFKSFCMVILYSQIAESGLSDEARVLMPFLA
jgi:hypothetical protein